MFVMLDYTNRALKETKARSYKIGLVSSRTQAGKKLSLKGYLPIYFECFLDL
jgi:hypothetical protein